MPKSSLKQLAVPQATPHRAISSGDIFRCNAYAIPAVKQSPLQTEPITLEI